MLPGATHEDPGISCRADADRWRFAASAENVLRFATGNEALSFDPHAAPHIFTPTGRCSVYEGLTHVSRDLRLMPSLATSWQVSGLTSWEFDIRDGVDSTTARR